jgi:hypothetical protein
MVGGDYACAAERCCQRTGLYAASWSLFCPRRMRGSGNIKRWITPAYIGHELEIRDHPRVICATTIIGAA